MNQPMHHQICPGPDGFSSGRRGFMRFGIAGFASLSLPGMLRLRSQPPTIQPREKSGHPGVATGRLFPHRYLRSQTGCGGGISRAVWNDRHQSIGHAVHGVVAAASEDRRQIHGAAQHVSRRGRPSGRLDADVVRGQRHARQAQTEIARLDVGDQLFAVARRPAHRIPCRLTWGSIRRRLTTDRPIWAMPMDRSRSPAIRIHQSLWCRTLD